MSDEKLIAIAKRLLELTRKGDINWEGTAIADRFFVAYPDSSISVHRGIRNSYVLSVRGETGLEIDSLREYPESATYPILEELFESARRSVIKPESVLDRILEHLNR